MFLFLKDKLSIIINRNQAEKINRERFEQQIYQNSELVDVYLELYGRYKKAIFFKYRIEYEGRISIYYVMFEKWIILVYCRIGNLL